MTYPYEHCWCCEGSGVDPEASKADPKPCHVCKGTGDPERVVVLPTDVPAPRDKEPQS